MPLWRHGIRSRRVKFTVDQENVRHSRPRQSGATPVIDMALKTRRACTVFECAGRAPRRSVDKATNKATGKTEGAGPVLPSRKPVYSTNTIECLNKEVRRRANAQGTIYHPDHPQRPLTLAAEQTAPNRDGVPAALAVRRPLGMQFAMLIHGPSPPCLWLGTQSVQSTHLGTQGGGPPAPDDRYVVYQRIGTCLTPAIGEPSVDAIEWKTILGQTGGGRAYICFGTKVLDEEIARRDSEGAMKLYAARDTARGHDRDLDRPPDRRSRGAGPGPAMA